MARVSDERRAPNDYRWARQVSALLLIAVVVLIVVLDVSVDGYEVRGAGPRESTDSFAAVRG